MILSTRVLYTHNIVFCVQCDAVSGDTETTSYVHTVVWFRTKVGMCKSKVAALLRATASLADRAATALLR